jgi:hypothetical protein
MRNLVERATAITVLATALVASGAGHAHAGLVTYTETATVSGSLGSTTFTGATITMIQTADPANGVTINPITHTLSVLDTTSTLVITGGGLASPLSASFTATTYTFSNPTATAGGFGPRLGPGIAFVLAETNEAFATYDLTTSLGPISGPSEINTGNPFATTAGSLNRNEADTVTFQAVATAVPEPSSLALGVVAGAIGLAIAAGRRLRRGGR